VGFIGWLLSLGPWWRFPGREGAKMVQGSGNSVEYVDAHMAKQVVVGSHLSVRVGIGLLPPPLGHLLAGSRVYRPTRRTWKNAQE